jgi:predicted nucleotidyltransferase
MAETGCPGSGNTTLMRLTPLEQQTALEFARRVRAHMAHRALDIRVFGSRSRGEGRADSDLDILILLDEVALKDRNDISDIGTNLLLEKLLPFPIAPRVMSKEHYEMLKSLERLLPTEIERDGITL